MLVIESIKKLQKDPSKVELFFDDSSKITLLLDTVAKFSLYEGREISQEEYKEIRNFDTKKQLRTKTLSFVTRSLKTEQQVREYIYRHCKGEDLQDDIADEIIEDLKDFGYIDDHEFAEVFLKSRVKNKPRSKYLLKSEMLSKGISKEICDEVLQELDINDFDLLKKLYEKKFKNERITFDDKKKISFLSRKGFSWDTISELINSFEENDA